MIKFIPTFIGISENPTIIVGEKPGKTRNNSFQALQDNDAGDFINEAISGHKNIILTNVVNLLYKGPFDRNIGIADGVLDLISLVEQFAPRKIITLGDYAKEYVSSIKTQCKIVSMPHPDWINKLPGNYKSDYIKKLNYELNN